jgi:nitrilase
VETVRVAAVQTSPVFLDRAATVDKVRTLVGKAAADGARLIVFPETFVPGYPDWVWRERPWSDVSAAWFARLLDQAVEVPSPATDAMGQAARGADAYLCVGVNERDVTSTTLYNTLLYFGPDGRLLGRHRKLVPTGGERLVWGMGDGSTLVVLDTPFGRLGGLTCWENYMPLVRAVLYAQGLDIYLAPTWDNSDVWVPTLRHIAREAGVFVVGVNFCMRGSDVPADLPGRDQLYGGDDDWLARGNTAIVGPDGEILSGPLVGCDGIVVADLDVGRARAVRARSRPPGVESRPDLFRLSVETSGPTSVTFAAEREERR